MKPEREAMRRLNRRMKGGLCVALVVIISSSAIVPVLAQQRRPIIISFGQPNIWSLEQAHYLLARMHRQNLDLQTAPLGQLDPNETNASRIDIVKTLLTAGVSFDQAVAVNNRLLRNDRNFNSNRRRELLTSRSSLQSESTQLAREIAVLRRNRARAATEAEGTAIDAEIDARTEEKSAVDSQLTQTNDELSGLTSASGEFQSPDLPDSIGTTELNGDLDEIINQVQLVNPSIAATLRLDNHIQLQYEIIAKQLTLLRDEVGPGERLVFLELPQSINATQDRADGRIAQTWWRIAGYTRVDKEAEFEASLAELSRKIDDLRMQLRSSMPSDPQERIKKAIASLNRKHEKLSQERLLRKIRAQQSEADRLLQGGSASTNEVMEKTRNLMARTPGDSSGQQVEAAVYKLDDANRGNKMENGREYVNLHNESVTPRETEASSSNRKNETYAPPLLRDRSVRTIDIIPRQNAINVNDTKQTFSRTGFFAAFSFLFGFAGKFTYERQREHAEQFLNQELFTSGFGKGETDFGWKFYPFAGTNTLTSGVRTTYAIAVIPDNAESIVLKARGCYFPRKENQPLDYNAAGTARWSNERQGFCSAREEVFTVPVPGNTGDGADYYVTGLRYSPNREPGERIIVSILGENLPSQVGVLINGIPLRQAIGLGQLNLEAILGMDQTRDNCVRDVCGRFERVDANQLVASFQMPAAFEGSPRITLIGPGRAIEINGLRLRINSDDDVSLEEAAQMFGQPDDPSQRRIADFKVAPAKQTDAGLVVRNAHKATNKAEYDSETLMTGVLTAGPLDCCETIYVNGRAATKQTCRKDLAIIDFAVQSTDYLTVTVEPSSAKERAVTRTFVNPSNLTIVSASVVSLVPGDADRPSILTVKLDGSGFKETVEVTIERSDGTTEEPRKIVASGGQMFLKILSPEAVVNVTLRDPTNNKTVSTVVVTPPVPERKQ